jgi:hypothetical protein
MSSTARPEVMRYIPPSRRGTRNIVVAVSETDQRRIRQLALDEGTSVQALGQEALNLLLKSRKKRPLEG